MLIQSRPPVVVEEVVEEFGIAEVEQLCRNLMRYIPYAAYVSDDGLTNHMTMTLQTLRLLGKIYDFQVSQNPTHYRLEFYIKMVAGNAFHKFNIFY